MTLPPVVSDPEGPCPGRLSLGGGDGGPHDFSEPWFEMAGNPQDWRWHADVMLCRYCGGRKPCEQGS